MDVSAIDFTIEDDTPVVRDNEFTPVVAKLIEAGDGKRLSFPVANDDVAKVRKLFRDAAHAADKTAKLRDKVENADGTTTLTFALVPRQFRPGSGPKPKDAADTTPAKGKGK